MADDQQVPVSPDAVAEPAATPAPPEPDAAPESDATPQETAPPTDAAPEPETPEPDLRAELEALRQQFESEKPKLEAYEHLQQQQAEAQRRAQIEETKRRFDERIADVTARLVAVDTEEQGRELLANFTRELLTGVQQATQHQVAQLQQQHQQQLQEYETTTEQRIKEMFKPGFADQVIAQYNLPNVPQVKDTLMQAANPDDMPAIAASLQAILAQTQPQVEQQVAAHHADARRAENVDAIGGVGGGPVNHEPMKPMSATSPESLEILGRILGR